MSFYPLHVSVVIWIFVITYSTAETPSMTPQELKEMDVKITSFLDKPTNSADWESLVKDMENIVQQLKLYTKLMRDNNQEMVQKSYEIYKIGKPKFIYNSLSEPEIRDAAQVSKEQFEHFHILRDDIDNLWDEFLDVISEKTGEILVYGKPPGFAEGGFGGYGDFGVEEETPGHGRGWGWQSEGGYRRGGRGRGRRRGSGGGYGNDFGPPF